MHQIFSLVKGHPSHVSISHGQLLQHRSVKEFVDAHILAQAFPAACLHHEFARQLVGGTGTVEVEGSECMNGINSAAAHLGSKG